jgi:hypothetical protein
MGGEAAHHHFLSKAVWYEKSKVIYFIGINPCPAASPCVHLLSISQRNSNGFSGIQAF